MKKLTVKEKEDKVILLFEDLTQLEAEYWEGVYLKQLIYHTVQTGNRNYAYIDKNVVSQMLSNSNCYLSFYVIEGKPYFEFKQYPNSYYHQWYGEAISLRLLEGYPVEFTKMQFTEDGNIVL